ncbi:MAG: triphosphoribosyl-dephospho-CoA synthase [Methylococcaceae bacterium]|jgi:triphosphoribosyl-dephospho-CoA synthase
MILAARLGELYQQACEIELLAFKPGNVSIYADGHDMTVADFSKSAQVSAEPLCNPAYSLGEKVFYAVKATRLAVGCNTNLGIILLCAPMIEAVLRHQPSETLRIALQKTLTNTTVADANWVFKAIALAAPGGLGDAEQQDVKNPASVNLQEAMQLASTKDRIAYQYASGYKDIFELAVLSYNASFNRFGYQSWAAVCVYADLLSQFPDSHIVRKHGDKYSEMVANKMALLHQELSNTDDPDQLKPMLYDLDKCFKSYGINPGTTADMTVATVMAVFLEDLISKT